MDKVTRQCPQITTFLKRKENRHGIEPRSFRLPASRLSARPNRLTNKTDRIRSIYIHTRHSRTLSTQCCPRDCGHGPKTPPWPETPPPHNSASMTSHVHIHTSRVLLIAWFKATSLLKTCFVQKSQPFYNR